MSKNLLVLALCPIACALAWQQAPQLPAPNLATTTPNPPKVVPQPEGSAIKLPKGFVIEEYAAGFARPRFMALGPSGEILLSDYVANGAVHVLNGKDRKKLVENLDRPYGIAFWKDYVYIAEATAVKRYKYDAKAMTAGPAEEIISLKGTAMGHISRTLAFDRAGTKLYMAMGSSANLVTGDPEFRAAINRYNPDGTGHEVVAGGLRNPVGLRFFPGTSDLWVTVQERDGLGDDLVPDFFTRVRQGGFYGWPYAYIGAHKEPRITEDRKDLIDRTIVPDVLLAPHVAVLDFLFYDGKQFPAEYRNGAFLANHGSSGRSQRLGYSVSFVPFKDGKPAGPVRDFASGWMLAPDKAEVWGRPVALLQMPDGSLLLSDDGAEKSGGFRTKGIDPHARRSLYNVSTVMIELTVNGKPRKFEGDGDVPLLWYLRDELDLTGAKFGCGMGLCGACTVHLNGDAIRSCVTPLSAAAGKRVTTIEGLSATGTHPCQAAWEKHNVAQCGYCQSGQIMQAAALLRKTPKPTDAQIDSAMDGNICRCGTYTRIRAAIKTAAGVK